MFRRRNLDLSALWEKMPPFSAPRFEDACFSVRCRLHVHFLDMSSCKHLQQLLVYDDIEGSEHDEPESELWFELDMTVSLERLILDCCVSLTDFQPLEHFQSLQILSLQDYAAATNEILFNIPRLHLEHLDLTDCKKIGGFAKIRSENMHEEFDDLHFGGLGWVSPKGTGVNGNDVSAFLLITPALTYLNLGKLTWPGLEIKSS